MVVVLPASIWAAIPMFRSSSSGCERGICLFLSLEKLRDCALQQKTLADSHGKGGLWAGCLR